MPALPPFLLRLALAVLIAALAVAAFRLVSAGLLARARALAARLAEFEPGTPGIVYFTTPDCVACRAAQRPALKELKDRLAGRLQVIEIDAYERPELAKAWRVLTVPTTFVLDRNGRARHVNQGVATASKLLSQLARFS